MNRAFSIYLDVVRFVAAFLVYLYHSNQRLLVQDVLPASHFGHSSVIVFFVLSGFVIAYITDTKERQWPAYAASRISRVYSVALPAVVLTLLLDGIGRQLMPGLYGYPYDQFAVRSAASLAMLNETWLVSITSFSNVPYWSICYESWYYLAFGAAMFLPRRWVALALLGMAVVIGPKIVLLAPIWISGVLLYRWKSLLNISLPWAVGLAVASVLGIVLFHTQGVEPLVSEWTKSMLGADLHTKLTFSKFFLSDYLLTVLVFANFTAMRRVAAATEWLWLPIEKPVRFVAGFTFTLYLLHQPLFLFWAAVLRGDAKGYGYWWATTALVLLSVVVVGHFTESRRHHLRRWLLTKLERIRAGSKVQGASKHAA